MYRYSPKNNTFYPEDIPYTTLPTDCIRVSKEEFIKYTNPPPVGSTRGTIGGQLGWVEVVTSSQDYESEERTWRDSELVRSDIELYKVQDSDPKSKGSVSDWRSYRKLLRSWPEALPFPNKEFRPKAPDAE